MKTKYHRHITTITNGYIQIGDFWQNRKICVQVVWRGLTAAVGIDVTIQLQQGNDSNAFDDIPPFVKNITTANDSVTFEHNDFLSTYLRLEVTVVDCTGGTFDIFTIAN